jgi:chorismate dehydratase
MTRIRLGAVGYLNARPHVFGLDREPRFALRLDIPSRCAALLHRGDVDVGLIPSIEYLQGGYAIVPDVAVASRGAVASVTLYTKRPMAEVRSIALDTSSRTSAALTRVLCARQFRIQPVFEAHGPDLESMLTRHDAALIIGDHALFAAAGDSIVGADPGGDRPSILETVDLGAAWTQMTGLPFVYAFWAGRPDALTPDDVQTLQLARDRGVERIEEICREYFPGDPSRQEVGVRYLRDNIRYHLGPEERAGLELFFRYAAEAHVVPATRPLQFYPGAPA